MTEIAIFGFGGIIFIITAWATVAFGVSRMHELQRQDLEDSPRIKEIKDQGLTEVYVTRDLESQNGPGLTSPSPNASGDNEVMRSESR